MPTVAEVIACLEVLAPPGLQEDYDNSGLQLGYREQEVKGTLLTLDCLEATVNEALEKGCNLIVAHHPIIFKGLKSIDTRHWVGRVVEKAIKNDIAIYAIHTNLDNALPGLNTYMAGLLGLTGLVPVRPLQHALSSMAGAGVVGALPDAVSEELFLMQVCEQLQLTYLRHTPLVGKPVRTVAYCGGSGSFLLQQAKAAGAQVFITGDVKHHEYLEADGEIVIADIGHWESERLVVEYLAYELRKKFANFATHLTERTGPPVALFLPK